MAKNICVNVRSLRKLTSGYIVLRHSQICICVVDWSMLYQAGGGGRGMAGGGGVQSPNMFDFPAEGLAITCSNV